MTRWQRSRLAVLMIGLACTGCLSQATEEDRPWFGVTAPQGIGDPHRPVVDVAAVSPPAAAVAVDDAGASELEGTLIREHLAAVVGFSRKSRSAGDRMWGRVTGFPAARVTLGWVAERFGEAGLEGVEIQEYTAEGELWWPDSWEVRLHGHPSFGTGSGDIVLESAVPTGNSLISGGVLSAPLVDTGSIADATDDLEVAGKVAVQSLQPVSGAYSERTATRERAQALMALGAVAVLNMVDQTDNMHVRDFSNCNGPCFNLGTADGTFLREVLRRAEEAGHSGEVRATLRLEASNRKGLVGHNTVGLLPGRSDEIIIINAHADGWFDAAGDNGDGLAVLVALAKHFGGAAEPLERTLVFVASGGHHSRGLNGPANFVAANPELTARAVLVLNLEHLAQLEIRSDGWTAQSAEQQMRFGISNEAPFLADVARHGMERYGFRLDPEFRAAVPGDLGGYRSLGVPRVQAIHSGPMYHTSGDVLETISVPGLERAARFHAFFVREVARASRNDFDPGAS